MRKALRVVLFMAFIFLFPFRVLAGGEATPEQLAQRMIRVINAGDAEALRQLVHPHTLQYFEQHDAKELERILKRAVENSIPAGYQIKVLDPKDNPLYNAKDNTMMSYWFPTPPERFLQISYLEPGDGTKTASRNNAAALHNGRWYLIFPTNTSKKLFRRRLWVIPSPV